jgi:acyl-CoA-dependent ceramide synthase
MSDASSPSATPHEIIEGESKVSYPKLHDIESIEQMSNGTPKNGLPYPTLIIKSKAKRKDDGPLEVVCGFVVEHQIGATKEPQSSIADYD